MVIENVKPQIDGGRFPIKRVVGERVDVTADIFADGHDALAATLKYRPASEPAWKEVPLRPLVNDAWEGRFTVESIGRYLYTIEAWVDPYQSWARDLKKRFDAGQDLSVEMLIGIEMIESAQKRAGGEDGKKLAASAASLKKLREKDPARAVEESNHAELLRLMHDHADRTRATLFERELAVIVDRERARFSSWYEMFPRSCAPDVGRHGTFRDCIARLDYVAGMGFDVLYLPPIHPVGRTNRKGKNNDPNAGHGDVGSPWAIGAEEGGHTAIHPQLGTLEDFHALVAAAKEKGLEIALDIAFQCTPDHPYVREHKEWFRIRPDGTVQYAENPPKKYQDIYPLYFDNDHAQELCKELTSVVEYWVDQGVHIFRVDNPHTKPFAFWEGLITQVKEKCPEAIFLSEAFTRPKVMYRLAKLGFTQSYTYFAWRNTKWELTQYFTELT
ncbi:MAG TPA: maltotransferase domain-containing protein, partial [Sphingomonadales bacterium]|nr:maltotransferase domain-containing protein [Sphingomonadales bacterium]